MEVAVISLIHPKHHGPHDDGESYLVEEVITPSNLAAAPRRAEWYAKHWRSVRPNQIHPSVRTFWRHARVPQLHIIRQHTSDDGAAYAVPQTFWLRLVQRRWRALLQQKRDRLVELSSPTALKYQQDNGTVLPTELDISPWWRARYSWMA